MSTYSRCADCGTRAVGGKRVCAECGGYRMLIEGVDVFPAPLGLPNWPSPEWIAGGPNDVGQTNVSRRLPRGCQCGRCVETPNSLVIRCSGTAARGVEL